MMNGKKIKCMLIALLIIVSACVSVNAASMNRKKAKICVSQTLQLKVKGATSKVVWKSSNRKVARVSANGLVTGRRVGKAVITASADGKQYKCKVTVKAGISLSRMTLTTGEIKKLRLLGTKIKNANSSNSAVAVVTKAGIVKAVGTGQAKITLTGTNKKKYTCTVTVEKAESKPVVVPTSIGMDSSITINAGTKVTLKVTFTPSDVSNKNLTWKSDNTSVATVNKGTVTGIKQGKTKIRATTHNGKTAVCEVIVQGHTSVIETSSLEEFSKAVSNVIKNNKVQNGNSAYSNEEFYSKRLIVKTNGSQLSFGKYNPTAIVKGLGYYYIVQFSTIDAARQAWGELSNNPAVAYIEPDAFCEGNASDTASGKNFNSWGVQKIYADRYAESLADVNGQVVVAVVDTGVSRHSFLDGRLLPGFDFVDGDNDVSDLNGHGTHVAGIIVDCTPGLNIRIKPVRVLDANGNGYHSTVGLGVLYAAETGANVVNLSLGGPHSNFKDEMIEYCIKKGITVVAAAGNDYGDTEKVCPAHLSAAIVVGAVDENGRKASFSNTGKTLDLVAPGVDIVSCIPGNKFKSLPGTSMAAPHVSAAAAMLLYENKGLSPSEVEKKLRNAATDLGETSWDSAYGAGLLNLMPFVKGLKEYTVSYDANGGTGAPSAQKKIHNEDLALSLTQPDNPYTVTFDYGTGKTDTRIVKASFDGWNTAANGNGTRYSPGGKYSQDSSVTLYAQWKGASVGALPVLDRDGYVLTGWYTSSSGGNQISESTLVSKNVTYYAHWKQRDAYTISYNANGGTGAPSAQEKEYGKALTLSSNTPQKSYTVQFDYGTGSSNKTVSVSFDGWNTKADGSGIYYEAGGTYNEEASAVLYAQWRAMSLGTLPTPTRDGYVLDGWYTASSGGTRISESTTVTKSITYYAHWNKKTTYTVSYDANGGTGAPSAQEKEPEKALKLSTVQPQKSYTIKYDYVTDSMTQGINIPFDSWNTAAGGTGTRYAPGDMYSQDAAVTLYAQWKTTILGTLPKTPVREGYEFEGWYTSISGGTMISESTTVTKSVTYYAHWRQKNKYTVSYNANGGNDAPTSQTKTEGESVEIPITVPSLSYSIVFYDESLGGEYSSKTIPVRFLSWNTKADGSGEVYVPGSIYSADASVTLYAKWENVTVGAIPALPSREGYVFEGWYTSSSGGTMISESTTVTKSITYYAHWRQKKTYTVSYNANGGNDAPASQTKTEGESVEIPITVPSLSYSIVFYDESSGGEYSSKTIDVPFLSWNTKLDGSGEAYSPRSKYSADASVTLYAKWESVTVGSIPTLPSREGYLFDGWYTKSSGGTKIDESTSVTQINNKYYARWKQVYTISYDAQKGTGAPASQEKIEGTDLILSSVQPKLIHTVTFDYNDGTGATKTKEVSVPFQYWLTGRNSGTPYKPGSVYSNNAPVTLYAIYTSSSVGELPAPSRTGYVLEGWYTSGTGGDRIYTTSTVAKDVTYYAHWRHEYYYTVTYNAEGGTDAPASQTKDEGKDLILSSSKPTKTNTVTFDYGTGEKKTKTVTASFDGWNIKIDGTGRCYMPGDTYSDDMSVNLHAQWTLARVGTLPEPTRDGYTFEGWYTKASGGTGITETLPVTTDITFYAHWKEKTPESDSADSGESTG